MYELSLELTILKNLEYINVHKSNYLSKGQGKELEQSWVFELTN